MLLVIITSTNNQNITSSNANVAMLVKIRTPKFLMVSGLSIIALTIVAVVTTMFEPNGCTITDIPDLISVGPREFVDKNYCGELDAFAFLPRALNYLVSFILTTSFLLLPFGILSLVVGVVLWAKRRISSKR